MPSFRVTLAIGDLAPGIAPAAILPAAKAAAQELVVMEAADLQVVSGQARIIVRFAADDEEIAAQVGSHVASRVQQFAEVTGCRITERVGARWELV
ncbi:hypothetical protein BH11ACT4_BH11ACT4_23830 [soil metagenome]